MFIFRVGDENGVTDRGLSWCCPPPPLVCCHALVMNSAEHVGMNSAHDAALDVTDLLPAQRSLRVAVVTETYPPEINGVALSLAKLVDGMLATRPHR